jgi:broad specificity phosphatase PhoE
MSAITRVLLLRHAESAEPDVFHGAESDIGLSARGQRQAAALGTILTAERPTIVISSAMRRARATADAIAAAGSVDVRIEPDLHERRMGVLAGVPIAKGLAAWEETRRRWDAGEIHSSHEGGESFARVQARVLPVWWRLTEEFAGQTYIVVAHGGTNKVLLLSLDVGLTGWESFHSPNLGINELILEDGRWRLVRVGEVPESVRRIN